MKIIRSILLTIFLGLVISILLFVVGRTDNRYIDAAEEFPLSKGSAPDNVRSEILQSLMDFQDGYTYRDVSQVEDFTSRLFSANEIIILGTMPDEVYIGIERAAQLIESDWKYWGDCQFLMQNAHISATNNVAWFSTIGTVQMDGINVTLPLRLSGVLVKNENEIWKFQKLQFQFDLNLRFLFLVIGLLLAGLIVNILILLYQTIRIIVRKASNINQNPK